MRRLGGFLLHWQLPGLPWADTASTGVLCLRQPGGDKDVAGRVGVAVLDDPACRAGPGADAERLGAVPVPAGRAELGGRLPATDLDHPAPVLGGLVLQQPDQG